MLSVAMAARLNGCSDDAVVVGNELMLPIVMAPGLSWCACERCKEKVLIRILLSRTLESYFELSFTFW